MKKPSPPPPPLPLPKFSIRAKRRKRMAVTSPAVCPMPPRPKSLSEEQLSAFKDQVLIVLADYRDSVNPDLLADVKTTNPLSSENTRVEIANRIVANLRIIAKVPAP